MAFQVVDARNVSGVLERILDQLSVLLEGDEAVDIVTFAENPKYLGRTLYPRQRLLLKLYYRVSLTDEELEDFKQLLSCSNKYAKVYFPGLCEHHITGICEKEACHLAENLQDLAILDDTEIRRRLKSHHAHILLVVAGRRGTKSTLGAIINLYEIYKFKRVSNPQEVYGLFPGSRMGTLNVATDEKQAQIIFDSMKALMDHSPWFQKLRYRSLETFIEFGQGIYARSLHSNSASVRGNTSICVNVDEINFFTQTLGKLSGKAMMNAIMPSTLLFGEHKRIVATSSPFNKAGVGWEYADAAIERKSPHIIYSQFASWEMNPTINPATDTEIQNAYLLDRVYAEMEYGGQWADQVGQYIPEEAVRDCANKELSNRRFGEKGIRYTLSVDMAKNRDSVGLIVCHYDKEKGKVIVDRIEEFDPKQPHPLYGMENMVNSHKEISHDLIERHIRTLTDQFKFRFSSITFDQFDSTAIIQRLRTKYGEDLVEVFTWNDRTNREVFSNLRSQVVQGGIEYPQHYELMKQLVSLSQTFKQSGQWKVEAPPGMADDLADPLAIATYMCLMNALGITSAVTGLRNELPIVIEPKSPIEGLEHDKECKPAFCVYNCPVNAAIMRGELQ